MAFLPLLPLSTVVGSGFLGFGIMWMLAIATFVFAQSKRRLLFLCLVPAALFLGMSLWVNYAASRNEIRQLVWYQQASLVDRLLRVRAMFDNFEWIDLSNPKHVYAVDGKLNQNMLVGAAVGRLESGLVSYAHGATAYNLIIALIPRVLWPEKPAVGGGGDVVAEFTGMRFASGTSVGAGQVLEFYVNFSTWGVIGGFLIYGWLLGYMDMRVSESLRQGNQRHFVFWFMLAVALLQPGGNLMEIVVSVPGAAVGAYGINQLFNRSRSTNRISASPRTIHI